MRFTLRVKPQSVNHASIRLKAVAAIAGCTERNDANATAEATCSDRDVMIDCVVALVAQRRL
ncbi:MAG: hypothetical protein ACXVEF_31460, partial [Polyangiales bacterium]